MKTDCRLHNWVWCIVLAGAATVSAQTYVVTDLDTLGTNASFATAVNASGQVSGCSVSGTNSARAWRYTPGVGLVDLGSFARRNFSIGCLLSFVLGMGLYGSVYLIPIFLAYARSHNAFDIGTTMLVTGLTQVVFAPVAAGIRQNLVERTAHHLLARQADGLQPLRAHFDELEVLVGHAQRHWRLRDERRQLQAEMILRRRPPATAVSSHQTHPPDEFF